MEVPATLMYDEVEQLYNDEVLNTRRELQESSANLEQLATYCEQSFLTCQDQQAVFDQSKGYVVQSLVNVSHRLTKLSTSLSQLLNTHNGRLEHINHQLHCIQQDFENIESYHSKEKVKSLGVTISIQRQHKVVQNKSINKDGKKHYRKPIDLSALDNIGHGVVVPDEPRPVPLYQSQNINNIVGREKVQRDMSREGFSSSRSHIFNTSLKQNGMGPRGDRGGDYMSSGGYNNNGYVPQQMPPQQMPPQQMPPQQMPPQQMPPQQMPLQQHPSNMVPHYNAALDSRTLDRDRGIERGLERGMERGMASLERNFDRALTIDRSMMYDPRQQIQMERHQMIGGIERISDRSSDRGSDQMSPSVHNQTTFNNWTPPQEDPRVRGLERPGYERSFSHGSGSHGSTQYERSVSSDEYAAQYPFNRRDSPHSAGVQQQQGPYPPQQPYSTQQFPPQHMTSQRSVTSQGSITSHGPQQPQPPASFLAQQFHSAKSYGSRGSLDDSSCTSSSPSLQSYKTSNSRNHPEFDDGSSQRSTNGPLSDSGLGTWAQSDIQQDKISQPTSDLETVDSGADMSYIPPNFIKKVQAIYRYNKSSDDELSLPVGAVVYVLQEHSDGWSEGFYQGNYGYFPANFTSVLVDR